MEAKWYRAMQCAQGKMLREYFSRVSVESLSRRYGYMYRDSLHFFRIYGFFQKILIFGCMKWTRQNLYSQYVLAILCLLFSARGSWASEFVSGPNPSNMTQKVADKVTGKIMTADGEPLAGASVMIRGTKIGTTADIDGNYSINAPGEGESYVLVFQYLGMKTKEITVSRQRLLDVRLEDDNELEGSVIVGAYGTKQSREDLIGSAFQVNAEQLKDKPKTRIDNLLSGLVPGMSIEPNTDAAGTTRSRYETRIRGEASLSASNEPLWVIDGVPVYTGGRTNQMAGTSYTVSPLSYLNPDDIESITVLKDADQVTIYGADGSNGVILVTTKSGTKNKPLSVSARVNFGVATIDKSTEFRMMSQKQYLEVAKEAWVNAGKNLNTFPYQDNDYNSYSTTDTDWSKEYFGVGTNLYADLSLTSGTDKMSNYVTGSYYRTNNTVKGDSQQRFSFRTRNTYDFTDWLKVNAQLSASYNDNDLFPLYRGYLETLPILEPYLNDGSFRLYNKVYDSATGWSMQKFTKNEVPDREANTNRQRSVVTSANFSAEVKIIDGLKFTAQYAIDYTHSHEDIYYSRMTLDGMDSAGNPKGSSRRADASYMNWTNVERLNFDRKFADRHSVSAYAGIELRQVKYQTLYATGSGFMNDNIQEVGYADESSRKGYSSANIERKMSFLGRAVYSYDSRYYASFNVRRDGNSDFGEYSRWSNFWSAGLSWNVHKERFFHSELVKMLKFKASFGFTGNSRVDTSGADGTYVYGSSYSYAGNTGAIIGSVPNPGLSWEKTRMINAGVRIELKKILDIELEYYDNVTSDMLSKIYVSRVLSSDRISSNIGRMRNTGIELSLSSTNLARRNFTWTTNFNMAHNTNKILELYNGVPTSFGSYAWMEGYDSQTWNLVRWAGVDPSDGSPMWYDKNGNVTRTFSTANRVPDKTRTPLLSGGLVNNMSWKNWTLSFQINYLIGGYALPTYAGIYFKDGYDIISANQAVEVYKYRWTTAGVPAKFPKVSNLSSKSAMNSTRFLYNRTNFDLTNVALTYNIPQSLLAKMRLKSASASLIIDNLYLFTPDQKKGLNSYKTMMYGYPRTRTLTLGINVGF